MIKQIKYNNNIKKQRFKDSKLELENFEKKVLRTFYRRFKSLIDRKLLIFQLN